MLVIRTRHISWLVSRQKTSYISFHNAAGGVKYRWRFYVVVLGINCESSLRIVTVAWSFLFLRSIFYEAELSY